MSVVHGEKYTLIFAHTHYGLVGCNDLSFRKCHFGPTGF